MYFTFGRRVAVIATSALLAMLLFPANSRAQLLDFPPPTHPSLLPVGSWTYGYPFIELTVSTVGPNHDGSNTLPVWTQGRTTYDGTYLTVEVFPQWITFATAPYWYQAAGVGEASGDSTLDSPCGPPGANGNPDPPIECGRVVLKMRMDSYTGALVGGTDTDLTFRGRVILAHWACDNGMVFPDCGGGTYHEAIDLDANGTLLTGRVLEAGSEYIDGTTARFNFNIRVTGGLLTDAGLGANKFDKNAFQLGVDIISSNFSGSFAAGAASGLAKGVAGGIPIQLGMAFCTGLVNGTVFNDINHNGLQETGEAGVTGAALTLRHNTDPPKSATSDANGRYAFAHACAGDSTIEITPPTGYVAATSSVIRNVPDGGIVSGVNFGIFQVPVGSFTTYKQAAWGAKPKESKSGETNAAKILADNFAAIYPGGEVVIGIPDTVGRYSITLTGAAVIQTFLPQGQKNLILTRSYVDPLSLWKPKHKGKYPHHIMISGFAGDVLALQLNVDFSRASVTRWGLGELHVVSGTLAGKTVNEVLALANRVLGGDPLPAGLTIDALDTVLEKINKNFESGAKDLLFLN